MTAAEYNRVPRVIGADYDSPIARSLQRTWETKPGIYGWISSVDHKEVGIRYLVTAFIFLILGGCMALVMRLQLARPDGRILTPEQYDELFSAHAITMIFLYAQPELSAFSNYLFPLVLGGRDPPGTANRRTCSSRPFTSPRPGDVRAARLFRRRRWRGSGARVGWLVRRR